MGTSTDKNRGSKKITQEQKKRFERLKEQRQQMERTNN